MDYIEREAAIEAVKKERYYIGKFSFEEERAWAVGFQQGITFAISDVATIPAADVRPVVLCRDCKCYRQSSFVDNHMECARSRLPVHPVDFCSYGEKREES